MGRLHSEAEPMQLQTNGHRARFGLGCSVRSKRTKSVQLDDIGLSLVRQPIRSGLAVWTFTFAVHAGPWRQLPTKP